MRPETFGTTFVLHALRWANNNNNNNNNIDDHNSNFNASISLFNEGMWFPSGTP